MDGREQIWIAAYAFGILGLFVLLLLYTADDGFRDALDTTAAFARDGSATAGRWIVEQAAEQMRRI